MSKNKKRGDNTDSCEFPYYLSSGGELKAGYISGDTFKNKKVEYMAINGMAVFQGDIILGTVEEMEKISKENEKLPPNRLLSVVVSGGQYRWPNGINTLYC